MGKIKNLRFTFLAILSLAAITLSATACNGNENAVEDSDNETSTEDQQSDSSTEEEVVLQPGFTSDNLVLMNFNEGDTVSAPLALNGKAKGTMYFEGTFEVQLTDEEGNEIASTKAQALEEWMTEDFVPFEASMNFPAPKVKSGFLVFKKDNPSGLPENDMEIKVAVKF